VEAEGVEVALASSRRTGAWLVVLAWALAAAASGTGGSVVSRPLISIPGPIAIQVWQPETDDLIPVNGRVTIGGAPVAGVVLRIGDYELPTPTGKTGAFTYLADATSLARDVVSVADDSRARLRGALLTPAQKTALAAQHALITVAYPLTDLRTGRNAHGDPTITGRVTFDNHRTAPPTVRLYSYQLSGTVTDSTGKPVAGAVVSTRTNDRNYWTISTPTNAFGQYTSLFAASDESGDNPVPMNIEVAIGNIVHSFLPSEFVNFHPLRSARLNIHLPPDGYAMAPPLPRSYPGAIYQGLVVGVSGARSTTVRPLSATWPDRAGRFTITLPRAFDGHSVTLWEAELQLFSTRPAVAGSAIQLTNWPPTVPGTAPRTIEHLRLP
jgi:hypothetical protein